MVRRTASIVPSTISDRVVCSRVEKKNEILFFPILMNEVFKNKSSLDLWKGFSESVIMQLNDRYMIPPPPIKIVTLLELKNFRFDFYIFKISNFFPKIDAFFKRK